MLLLRVHHEKYVGRKAISHVGPGVEAATHGLRPLLPLRSHRVRNLVHVEAGPGDRQGDAGALPLLVAIHVTLVLLPRSDERVTGKFQQ